MTRGGHNRVDLSGRRYGRLVVLKHSETRGKRAYWLCKCDCGVERLVSGSSLKSAHVQSCGCLRKQLVAQRSYKHGLKRRNVQPSKAYRVWSAMMSRCYSKSNKDYPLYGGRGVRVCRLWQDAVAFVTWYESNKPKKGKFSIDRYPNTNGSYSPSNCRFATDAEQVRNRRMTAQVHINGEKLCLKDAVEKYGTVSYSRAKVRVREQGWTPLEAVTTPDQRRVK